MPPARKPRTKRLSASRKLEAMPPGVRESLPAESLDIAFIMMRLARLSRLVQDVHHEQLRGVSMSFSEYSALHALSLSPPPHRLSPSRLNESLGLSSGGITKTVDRLESAGLVRRVPDPDDGRGVLVQLTARGHRRANLIFSKGLEHYADLFSGRPTGELEVIAGSLHTLLEVFEEQQL